MSAEPEQPGVGPPAAHWPAGVGALATTRRGAAEATGEFGFNLADHVGDRQGAVAANRQTLCRAIGVADVQWLRQVHGHRCVAATSAMVRTVPEADAAWTTVPGLAVAVLTADCVPVVVADRHGTVVGVAHGGWRGLVGGVVEALVAALPAAPADLVAWIGPAIGPDAYEVGDDVAGAVRGLDAGGTLAAASLYRGRAPGKHQLDLFALTTLLLERAGVGEVHCERLCTYSDERFYSYRREGRTGRMATLAWLQD